MQSENSAKYFNLILISKIWFLISHTNLFCWNLAVYADFLTWLYTWLEIILLITNIGQDFIIISNCPTFEIQYQSCGFYLLVLWFIRWWWIIETTLKSRTGFYNFSIFHFIDWSPIHYGRNAFQLKEVSLEHFKIQKFQCKLLKFKIIHSLKK